MLQKGNELINLPRQSPGRQCPSRSVPYEPNWFVATRSNDIETVWRPRDGSDTVVASIDSSIAGASLEYIVDGNAAFGSAAEHDKAATGTKSKLLLMHIRSLLL
jgi:hypothetical protein